MSEFTYEPAFPMIETDVYGQRRHWFGITIRQQAVLSAPAEEILALAPATKAGCANLLRMPIDEYDGNRHYARVLGILRCQWADAVLKSERETR